MHLFIVEPVKITSNVWYDKLVKSIDDIRKDYLKDLYDLRKRYRCEIADAISKALNEYKEV